MSLPDKDMCLFRLQHLALELTREIFEKGGLGKIARGIDLTITDHATYDDQELMTVISVVNLKKRAAWTEASLKAKEKREALVKIACESINRGGWTRDHWLEALGKAQQEYLEANAALQNLTERMKA